MEMNFSTSAAALVAEIASGGNASNESALGLNKNESPMEVLPDPVIKLIHDILIVVLLVAVMFAMGCHITCGEVWQHIRRPIGVFIGMSSQFVLLPLAAFCLILGLGVDPSYATGMLVLACSPGGVTSNIFSYFCDGDISLSVTMTTCSTIVALGLMPFNMWLYGHQLQTGHLVMPYGKMSISLATVTAPVGLGMLVRWKYPKIAPYFTKVGSYAGFAIIFVCQTMELIIFPDIFDGITWNFYVALCVLPAIGLSLGYGLAFACRQAPPIRKTIAIECSIQNIGTALTIISLSFPIKMQKKILAFPWLYSIPLLTTVTVTCICYQVYKKYYLQDPSEKKVTMNGKIAVITSMEKVANCKSEESESFIIPEKITIA